MLHSTTTGRIERIEATVRRVACATLASALFACGGAPPPSAEAPSAAPAAPPVAEAPAPEPPVDAPPAPRHVTTTKIEIKGGGIDEAAVQSALDAQSDAFEGCYATTRQTTPEAEGRMILSYLFMKGERKSVSASHSGPGSESLNSCFQSAATELQLSTDAAAERTTIFIELGMSREAK